MVRKVAESRLVKTARKKLEKRLSQEKAKFSPESLTAARQAIRSSIARKYDTNYLINRTFSLFDENSHTAPPKSKAIIKLSALIRKDSARL